MIKVKASLHLHSHEDGEDADQISYSIYQLIGEAGRLGFKVLALTGHKTYICRPEYIAYAKKKGILLLPGVELALFDRRDSFLARHDLDGRHCLVINCRKEAEKIKTFTELASYRRKNPDALIIAAHPNHGFGVSMGLRRLDKYHKLFDAAEHSWFYTKLINPNRATEKACRQLNLPFIATADLHFLQFLSGDYAELELKALTPAGVNEAVRAGRFKNFSRPKNIWTLISSNFSMLSQSLLDKLIIKKKSG